MAQIYDTIIIGGGPAGLSAGLYAARSRMNTLIIERAKYGGQATTTDELENYPGSIEECTGTTLSKRMKKQAEDFGTKFTKDEIVEVNLEGNIKVVKGKKETYEAKTIIIATGANPKLSGFKNETELRGKGISYCATCDADFFTDLDVAVIGGGDSAITEAIYLTKFAEKVTVIHRRDALRAAKSLQEKAFDNPKIDFIWNSTIEEAVGDEILEKLILKNKLTGETSELKVDGCFVFVGYDPISSLFEGKLDMEKGYIITDEDMQTSVAGVFAAGDVRKKSLRQVITAAADGAIAATIAERYLEEHK
ncbi:thioredoxin reductase [Clostridium carboxidivorans P7]|uniref:Thioredoxin reductase n=1 Tax=Clostridium carboxidivorans P7 TaxID=536227 RepID=C6PSB9_9CLOT|nr:thioredoxin-disulfide reductase [Clostridium carboxidivorans]AKN33375.1 thioredoxin reductase [Clostridium carboxidivorans P7]EET87916.1 thioredoxin reductase [Clostridium carboxidivorans P7]EFG89248.1 thioredoxin-disulfide reductase [Clostridium carboxidivorans P7]